MNNIINKTKITFLIYLIFVLSCKSNKSAKSSIVVKTVKENKNQLMDTLILLKDVKKSSYNGSQLNKIEVKGILNSFAKKQGYYTDEELLDSKPNIDYNNFVLTYDTVYYVDLNKNNFRDAIVLFWLIPPNASGNCWQPNKAIIMDTDSGYLLQHLNFISTDFVIDSVISTDVNIIVYGYKYDCDEHTTLKKYKIYIK